MDKKRKEIQGLKANPKRQGVYSLRGYLYQIWHSVNAWLDLSGNEILYLEGAEDFDKLSESNATVVQVKATRRRITLRSQEVIEAVNNYWEIRDKNPDKKVKFRFLTRSKIGKEKGDPFGKTLPGLHLWNRCSQESDTVCKIVEFLQGSKGISPDIKDFLRQENPVRVFQCLIEPVTWETESKSATFVEESIRGKLILHGDRYNILPDISGNVATHILQKTLEVTTQPNNRKLTRVDFLEIFEEKTTQRVPINSLQYLSHAPPKNFLGSVSTGEPSEIIIHSGIPIQIDVPPTYPDVASRENLVKTILTQLRLRGSAVVWGGRGMGKTTLAKLSASSDRESWVWLNLTNKVSSQTCEILTNLGNSFTGVSKRKDIILDDLDLQPAALKQYEDALGVLIYRVLESKKRILLTSQNKPPNNLMRRLSLATEVGIKVPGFTELEIAEFATQLGCPSKITENTAKLVWIHTSGHPRLVHARLIRLRETGWNQDFGGAILQTPSEVVEEREEARQLLLDLPDHQRELLYRLSLMFTRFRREVAIAVGEIPESIPYPGDILSQVVGPWIDPVDDTYFAVSPLLSNAATMVWSTSKVNRIESEIADSFLRQKTLRTVEAQAAFIHSMKGNNKLGLISVINALIAVPIENWEPLSKEFAWMTYIHTNPPKELFPGEGLPNHLFRLVQYRIAVNVDPEYAPKIMAIWDKETRSYESDKEYNQARTTLGVHALLYVKVLLPVKQMVTYIEEIIEISNRSNEVQEFFRDIKIQPDAHIDGHPNPYSLLFTFILQRRPFFPTYLKDLIESLDALSEQARSLILGNFEKESIHCQLFTDNIWLAEENEDKPNWSACIEIYDELIQKSINWRFPQIAFAAARSKAIIYDEHLGDSEAAHSIFQEITSQLGPSHIIEEAQGFVYLRQAQYHKAFQIYNLLLSSWDSSGQLDDLRFIEIFRRGAISAAHSGNWPVAAHFFFEAGNLAQRFGEIERSIGFFADSSFATFKAGKIKDSLVLFQSSLENFCNLPQNEADLGYFTLKRLFGYMVTWLAKHGQKGFSLTEPLPGLCSNPETADEILTFPNPPIQYVWVHLAEMEYRFNLGSTTFEKVRNFDETLFFPYLYFSIARLEILQTYKIANFEKLPWSIQEFGRAFLSNQKQRESGKGIEERGSFSVSKEELTDFASVPNLTDMLVAALLVQISHEDDLDHVLAIWCTQSQKLAIKKNLVVLLDLIEEILSDNESNPSTVMLSPDPKYEHRLIAALKIVRGNDSSPENLFLAHFFLTNLFLAKEETWQWEDHLIPRLAILFSKQWMEKTKFNALYKAPMITIPQIQQACKSIKSGKKKIGEILHAVYQGVSVRLSQSDLQRIRSWAYN